MYCVAHLGKGKEDYQKGFQSVLATYHDIGEFLHDVNYKKAVTEQLFEKIEKVLRSKKFTDDKIAEVGSLLYEFEANHETKFRHELIRLWTTAHAKSIYPAALYNEVRNIIEADPYDAPVVEAFKYLDRHLQMILNIKPYEHYGESLINYAFAPNSGALQLSTSSSEQSGLRNFFSGANALFRNLAAHRSLFSSDALFRYDTGGLGDAESITPAIIALVGLMARIATSLFMKEIEPIIGDVLKDFAIQIGWDSNINKIGPYWVAGPLEDKSLRGIYAYRVRLLFSDDKAGCCLKLQAHDEVTEADIDILKKLLKQKTHLPIERTAYTKD